MTQKLADNLVEEEGKEGETKEQVVVFEEISIFFSRHFF